MTATPLFPCWLTAIDKSSGKMMTLVAKIGTDFIAIEGAFRHGVRFGEKEYQISENDLMLIDNIEGIKFV